MMERVLVQSLWVGPGADPVAIRKELEHLAEVVEQVRVDPRLVAWVESHPKLPRLSDIKGLIAHARWSLRNGNMRDTQNAMALLRERCREWDATVQRPAQETGQKIKRATSQGGQTRAAQIRSERHPEWARWQRCADEFWARNPDACKSQIANNVIRTLRLKASQKKTVERRIKKVEQ